MTVLDEIYEKCLTAEITKFKRKLSVRYLSSNSLKMYIAINQKKQIQMFSYIDDAFVQLCQQGLEYIDLILSRRIRPPLPFSKWSVLDTTLNCI